MEVGWGRRECRPIRDSRLDGVKAKGNGEFLDTSIAGTNSAMRLPSSGYFQLIVEHGGGGADVMSADSRQST